MPWALFSDILRPPSSPITDDAERPQRRQAGAPPRPLRVLHVDAGRVWRGGQRQALLLAEALRDAGHESLCAFMAGAPLAERAVAAGLRLLPFTARGEWDLGAARRLRRQVRDLRPDVLHAHDNHATTLALLAGAGHTPVVASRRVPFRSRRNPLSRLKLRSVRHWIAISEATRRGLLKAGVRPDRIEIVHSGIRLPAAPGDRPSGPTLRSRFGLPADCFVVLTGGWLEPVKGQRTFVESAAFADDLGSTRWIVAGEGPDRRFLELLATSLGIADRVVLAGTIPDLPERMREVQISVLASYWEGLGTVLLDALAAGVPVVGTEGSGIPDAVADGAEGLLVPVGDARSVARAVRRLYLDPSLRLEMGDRARRRAQDFGIAATVEGTLRVYRGVLAGGAKAARDSGTSLPKTTYNRPWSTS